MSSSRRLGQFSKSLICLGLLLCSACGVIGYGANTAVVRPPVYHTVARGETVFQVAKRYGVSYRTIMMLNGLRDPRRASVGQKLLVGYRRGETNPSRGQGQTDVRGDGKLGWPLKKGRLVSRFGPRWSSFHDGIDFAAPTGTPVYAAHSGRVSYVGQRLRGYGKLVLIRGNDGLITVYAHNSRIRVRKGERVSRGERIADVGSTGKSSGPHLHFEVRMKDRRGRYVAVDPLPILEGTNIKPRYRVNESLTPLLAKRSN